MLSKYENLTFMNKQILTLLFCWGTVFLGFAGHTEAQTGLAVDRQFSPAPVPFFQPVPAFLPVFSLEKKASTPAPAEAVNQSLMVNAFPSAYQFDQLGFFCKLEVRAEKKFRVPVKVRLGEVWYTEGLEYGKDY